MCKLIMSDLASQLAIHLSALPTWPAAASGCCTPSASGGNTRRAHEGHADSPSVGGAGSTCVPVSKPFRDSRSMPGSGSWPTLVGGAHSAEAPPEAATISGYAAANAWASEGGKGVCSPGAAKEMGAGCKDTRGAKGRCQAAAIACGEMLMGQVGGRGELTVREVNRVIRSIEGHDCIKSATCVQLEG